MPRMAATPQSNRTFRRSRQTSEHVPTPVLIRFPFLQQQASPQIAEAEEQRFDDPRAAAAQNAKSAPVANMQSAAAATIPSQQPEPPPVVANEIRNAPKAIPSSAAASTLTVAAERSWWEHWSSGIVLLLLIVALITASIVALNDSTVGDPELLADTSGESSVFDSSLSNLMIPEIGVSAMPETLAAQSMAPVETAPQSPAVEMPLSDGGASAPARGELARGELARGELELVATLPAGNPTPTFTEARSQGQPVAGDAAQASAPSSSTAKPVPTLAGSSLIPSSLELGSAATKSTPPQAGLAQGPNELTLTGPNGSTASLKAPVAEIPLPLFSEQESQSHNGGLPAQSVSRTLPQASGGASGASPNFYDGAQAGLPTSQALSSDPQSLLATRPAMPSGSVPDSAEVPGSSARANVPAQLAAGPASAVISSATLNPGASSSPELGGPLNSRNQIATGPIPTATPHSDADAIIRSFQSFVQMRDAQQNGSNRYQTQNSASRGQPSPSIGPR